MKPENLGLRILNKYQSDAVPVETDLMGAEFACGVYSQTAPKMSVDDRNKMRELRWWRDPHMDTWVFVP